MGWPPGLWYLSGHRCWLPDPWGIDTLYPGDPKDECHDIPSRELPQTDRHRCCRLRRFRREPKASEAWRHCAGFGRHTACGLTVRPMFGLTKLRRRGGIISGVCSLGQLHLPQISAAASQETPRLRLTARAALTCISRKLLLSDVAASGGLVGPGLLGQSQRFLRLSKLGATSVRTTSQ